MQFLLGNWKPFAFGIAVVLVFAAYRHYDGLVDEKARLTAENAQLGTALWAQSAATAAWKAERDSLLSVMAEWAAASESAGEEGRRLDEMFADHDLKGLAMGRPGLVEVRIDRGTGRILRLLETATADTSRR